MWLIWPDHINGYSELCTVRTIDSTQLCRSNLKHIRKTTISTLIDRHKQSLATILLYEDSKIAISLVDK